MLSLNVKLVAPEATAWVDEPLASTRPLVLKPLTVPASVYAVVSSLLPPPQEANATTVAQVIKNAKPLRRCVFKAHSVVSFVQTTVAPTHKVIYQLMSGLQQVF
jgi:hypothetical protein